MGTVNSGGSFVNLPRPFLALPEGIPTFYTVCEESAWYEVLVKYSYDEGASWSTPYDISALTDDIDRGPSGVYDANGNLHVVWEGFCCGHKLRMRYRGRFAGVWEPTITTITSHVGGHIPNSLQCRGTTLYLVFSDSDTNIGLYDVEYTWTDPTRPRIALSASSFTHSILIGGSVANDQLTIRNECVGTLDYTVASNQPWLAVSPPGGSLTTETNAITLSYPTASQMRASTYDATVTISGNASNNPQTVAVRLVVRSVKPDFDGDGDVDHADFGAFQACLSGPFVTQDRPECLAMRLDVTDDDVDGDDFATLENCLSGSGMRADMGCAALYP